MVLFWLFVADVMAGLQTGDVPMQRRFIPPFFSHR